MSLREELAPERDVGADPREDDVVLWDGRPVVVQYVDAAEVRWWMGGGRYALRRHDWHVALDAMHPQDILWRAP